MNRFIFVLISIVILSDRVFAQGLTGIVTVRETQFQAESSCRIRTWRLPTLEEYILSFNGEIVSGSPELREISVDDPLVKAEMERFEAQGYFPVVKIINRDQKRIKIVDYYYGYPSGRFPGASQEYLFWSSTLYSNELGNYAYLFDGYSGKAVVGLRNDHHRYYRYAVRCWVD